MRSMLLDAKHHQGIQHENDVAEWEVRFRTAARNFQDSPIRVALQLQEGIRAEFKTECRYDRFRAIFAKGSKERVRWNVSLNCRIDRESQSELFDTAGRTTSRSHDVTK